MEDNTENLFVVIIMVKDEEHSIIPTLKPYVGYTNNFFIYDTGSTDKTIEVIENFFIENSVTNYKIITEEFVNFSVSRNKCLDYTRELFSNVTFMMMPDAEWYFTNVSGLVEHSKKIRGLLYDQHSIDLKLTNSIYKNPRLMRIAGKSYFKGPVHEYLVGSLCPIPVPSDVYFSYLPSQKGNLQSAKRWEKDLKLLLDEFSKNENEPRTVYYLAQTYSCLGDVKNALFYYMGRSRMEIGHDEERYLATFKTAECFEKLDNWPMAQEFYLKSYEMRPTRIEALVKLAKHHNNPQAKYMYSTQATRVPFPETDLLEVNRNVYDYDRWEQLSISAWYMHQYDESYESLKKILPFNSNKNHLCQNMGFTLKMMENKSKELKILNLVLYSEDENYFKMKEILNKYYSYLKNFINIDHYFYCFKEDLNSEYLIENEMIYIKGKESFLGGILDKTLKTLDLFKDSDYDYVVRTNISSVIDFESLSNWLYYNPMDYGGPFNYSGCNQVDSDGLTQENFEKYKNVPFVGGNCIVMSLKFVRSLLEIKNEILHLGIIDDVSIGIAYDMLKFLNKKENKNSGIITKETKDSGIITKETKDSGIITKETKDSGIITKENKNSGIISNNFVKGYLDFYHILHNATKIDRFKFLYRNKRDDRNKDVVAIEIIVQNLVADQNKKHGYENKFILENFDKLKNNYYSSMLETSDINEHLEDIYKLTLECSSVIEIGVRNMVSTWGFLYGLRNKENANYLGIDLNFPPDLKIAEKICNDNSIKFNFIAKNDMLIEETFESDIIFFDSLHTYCHLTYELEKFSGMSKKYMCFHDSSGPWEATDDILYTGDFSEYPEHINKTKRGVWQAIQDFLEKNEKIWKLKSRKTNNNGFTVLERI